MNDTSQLRVHQMHRHHHHEQSLLKEACTRMLGLRRSHAGLQATRLRLLGRRKCALSVLGAQGLLGAFGKSDRNGLVAGLLPSLWLPYCARKLLHAKMPQERLRASHAAWCATGAETSILKMGWSAVGRKRTDSPRVCGILFDNPTISQPRGDLATAWKRSTCPVSL
jgi:hypothetical protein